jgi:hypothetical protein
VDRSEALHFPILCIAAVICSGCGPTELQRTQLKIEDQRYQAEMRAIDDRYKKIIEADHAHLTIGMSEVDAMGGLGIPDHVNTTQTAKGTREQWVYPDIGYLYFADGKLVAIQRTGE